MTYLQAIEYLFDQGVIKVVMSTGAEFTIKEALRSAYQIMASGTAYSKANFVVNAGSLGVFRADEERRFPLLECQGWTKAEVEAARVLTEVKAARDYYFEDANGYKYGPFAATTEAGAIDVFCQDVGGDFQLMRGNWNITYKNQAAVALGAAGGSKKSEAKAEAVRKNGAKGGRPKKDFLKQEFRFTPTRNGRQTAEQSYTMTAGEFIMLAEDVADRGGTSLEAFAGVDLVGVGEPNHFGQYSDYKYARTLEGKERFEVALKFEANRIDCRIDSKKVTK